jgi:hypothetical protein
MLAVRRSVEERVPELLAASRLGWESWLESQRLPDSSHLDQRIICIAELTCLEDLPLHVGLIQLLVAHGSRCRVLLSLPTLEMANLVRERARRESWHELVYIDSVAGCRRKLEVLNRADTLVVFVAPSALSEDDLGDVASLAARSAVAISTGRPCFIGTVEEFAGRAMAIIDSNFEQAIVDGLDTLLAQEFSSIGEVPQVVGPLETAPIDVCSWPAEDGGVRIPDLGTDDELVVTAHEKNGAVIARCLLPHKDEEPWKIRVPTSMITIAPQPVRVDAIRSEGASLRAEGFMHVPPSRLEPWMLSAFLNRGGAGNPVIRAFADGVGCRIAYAEDEPSLLSDIPIVWGVLRQSDRILAQARAQDLYYFYIDHAYFNRGHGRTYRITRNAYDAGPVRDCPDDRLAALRLEISPWNEDGHEIIVCPPTEYFAQAHGCPDWLETTLSTLGSLSDRPIIIRNKPKAGEQVKPLPEALRTAHALVTHSSNVAIEAACLGTPVFVSPSSAAAPVGSTDLREIERPRRPDRRPWLAHLAYNQCSIDEIESGLAWKLLLAQEERPFA